MIKSGRIRSKIENSQRKCICINLKIKIKCEETLEGVKSGSFRKGNF